MLISEFIGVTAAFYKCNTIDTKFQSQAKIRQVLVKKVLAYAYSTLQVYSTGVISAEKISRLTARLADPVIEFFCVIYFFFASMAQGRGLGRTLNANITG